ncbi:hypothetical protein KYC5002_38910 [Archangium violaceum]|uniref:hypothetical protein n=1 Tax=Archangium violaceum TaxID=83451 RepID=UPI002B29194D|nr:hypothetical protein KYC5002_38910 [Archangium gephyra]
MKRRMRRGVPLAALLGGLACLSAFAGGHGAATGAVVGAAADGLDGAVRGAAVGGTMDALTYTPGEHSHVTTRAEVRRGATTGAVVGAAADGLDGAVAGAVAGGALAHID